MIQLFYTGALSSNAIQQNSLQSLGGYVSSTIIPNDQIDALFGGISQIALIDGSEEYRCLAFVNQSNVTKTISLYYNNLSSDPVSSFKMALVAPASDSCNRVIFQKVNSGFSKPMVSFTDNRGVDNAITFDITANQVLGLWIQRTVNKGQGSDFLSCSSMIKRFELTDVNQIDTITFDSNQVQQTYWTINTATASIFISYDALSTDLIGNNEIIKLIIPANSTSSEVATLTRNKLNSILESRQECVCTSNDNTLIITHLIAGKITPPTTQTSPITITSISGSSNKTELTENLEICIDY